MLVHHDKILDATDALGQAGCTDASIRGHADGMEVMFERAADTLQDAIFSAILMLNERDFTLQKLS